jgi:hypothetical protein
LLDAFGNDVGVRAALEHVSLGQVGEIARVVAEAALLAADIYDMRPPFNPIDV